MEKKRWKILKKIFSEALLFKDDERKEFIIRAADGDKTIIKEAVALLEAYEKASLLDHPFEEIKKSALGGFDTERKKGKHFGPYKIINSVGHGGMGSVYLAERADGNFNQRVALKLLRTGLHSNEQVQRFLYERQILASLNHENIARLFDGGVTEEGQPWFVMEYVEGKPINEYCDEHKLSLDDRLQLFLDVCKAVQYAHQKLIVHRDIKPSNILVKKNGTIKLLDFGIAKALNSDDYIHNEIPVTQTGLFPLTPAYASPEQIRGETVSTVSDIYQLGVVLYELLTGYQPYDVSGKTPSEIEQVICEDHPTRPSSIISKMESSAPEYENVIQDRSKWLLLILGKQKRKLRGDLDTVILMALRKEPDRRYSSAEQFAKDIKNYLADRPVTAHSDSWSYRSKKFISRHKAGVSVSAAILFMLILYTSTVTWHSQQTREALYYATEEAAKSEQLISFMMGMFEANDPAEAMGDTVTARVLLERGIEQAETLDNQPEIQAQMFSVVGKVYYQLGEYERAYPLLRQSIDIKNDMGQPEKIEQADSYYLLGATMHHKGNYRDSDYYFETALDIYNSFTDHESVEYANSLYRAANIRGVRRDFESAFSMHEQALHMRLNLLGELHPEVGNSYKSVGNTLHQKGDPAKAIKYFRKAADIYGVVYPEKHPAIADLKVSKARALQVLKKFDKAEMNLITALEIQTDIYGEHHTNTGLSKMALGNFYRNTGDFAKAEPIYFELISVIENELGGDHPLKRPVTEALGRLYLQKNEPEKAESWLRKTTQLLSSSLRPEHPRVLTAEYRLADCLLQLQEYEEAEALLLQVLDHTGDRSNETHTSIKKEALHMVVALYESWNRKDQAEIFSSRLQDMDAIE
ncbi:MAG: tetratricopeptide repeat protein [Balneolaceae bacterium]|nr:tetratricopeptide repeat protein [Balneolaceae bacterium]